MFLGNQYSGLHPCRLLSIAGHWNDSASRFCAIGRLQQAVGWAIDSCSPLGDRLGELGLLVFESDLLVTALVKSTSPVAPKRAKLKARRQGSAGLSRETVDDFGKTSTVTKLSSVEPRSSQIRPDVSNCTLQTPARGWLGAGRSREWQAWRPPASPVRPTWIS
jgi:hypothetical protein